MATNTTNNYFSKPAVGGDTDTWGTTLNANWDAVDSIVTGGTSITRLGIGTTNSTLPLICNAASATDIAASFSGFVGIGTTSPLYNLVVNDAASSVIQIRSGSDDAGHLYFADTDDDNIGGVSYSHQYNFMNFKTNDTERMRVDSSGNVGIGTTDPNKKLHVSGGDVRIESTFPRLYLTDTDNNSDYSIINNNGQFGIYDDSSGAYRMQINADGATTIVNRLDLNTYLRTNRIDNKSGQQLVLNAGESASVATGQAGELVYVNAEDGLQVNTTTDNWTSGWAGRKTALIKGDLITVDGAINAGNATFDNGTSTTVSVLCDDAGNATLRLMGGNQGTGRLYVGQSSTHGGGIEYNGDSDPVTSGGGSDNIVLYRRSSSVNEWTARNNHANNDWEFRGKVTANQLAGTLTQSIFNQIYPVGAVYISTSATNPQTLFGGTWTAIGGGRVLQTVSGSTPAAGQNYGYNSRAITTSNMPSHTHAFTDFTFQESTNLGGQTGQGLGQGLGSGDSDSDNYPARPRSATTGSTGSGTNFDVRQASYGVYMWKRATLA